MSAGWMRSKWPDFVYQKMPQNVMVVFPSFFLILFFPGTRRGQIFFFLHFGVNTKEAGSSYNSAFFHCWSFSPFKPSLFIAWLYRPCLLFFTPFTPLSLGCLPLHFMPTSITLHWSKWSGPSCGYTICLLNASPATVCSRKLFCNVQKWFSEMSFVLLERSGEISAQKGLKKALHLQMCINKDASAFALNIQGQKDNTSLLERPLKGICLDATHLFPYLFTCKIHNPQPFFLPSKIFVQCAVNKLCDLLVWDGNWCA